MYTFWSVGHNQQPHPHRKPPRFAHRQAARVKVCIGFGWHAVAVV
jgi:hypothetical protein